MFLFFKINNYILGQLIFFVVVKIERERERERKKINYYFIFLLKINF